VTFVDRQFDEVVALPPIHPPSVRPLG
jgi:hypothetical protein